MSEMMERNLLTVCTLNCQPYITRAEQFGFNGFLLFSIFTHTQCRVLDPVH